MNAIRWIVALGLGGFLIFFGVMKFTGGAHIFPYIEYRANLNGFPLADLFFPLVNYATGALEILAGALVILPMTRRIGAPLALLPLVGAVGFHLSLLLGVSVPVGYADGAPPDTLADGGPFVASHFATEFTPMLFYTAVAVTIVALVNYVVNGRR